MALSEMNSREKTVLVVLVLIIAAALVGIGVLAARLIAGDAEEQATNITVAPESQVEAAVPEGTATLVANPELVEEPVIPPPAGAQPVPVVQVESPGPLLPAILADQALHPGRQYRVEIAATDGSKTEVRGSWSHSAKSADGHLEMPLPEEIEGTTPLTLDLVAPVANAMAWSVSVSAAPRDLLAQPPRLTITVWDVTGNP
jgi:hypothetical protein